MSNLTEKDNQILNMKEEDILSKLMGEHEVPSATFIMDRLEIKLDLKGMTEKEISNIRKQCTKSKKRKGVWEEKTDNAEFDAAIVVGGTTNFDWNNPKLLEAHEASEGTKLVRKILLAGEISNIVNKVLELSGFNDELEEAEDIKN